MTCGHRCRKSCHDGSCSTPAECRKKVVRRCKCGHRRVETPCVEIQALLKEQASCGGGGDSSGDVAGARAKARAGDDIISAQLPPLACDAGCGEQRARDAKQRAAEAEKQAAIDKAQREADARKVEAFEASRSGKKNRKRKQRKEHVEHDDQSQQNNLFVSHDTLVLVALLVGLLALLWAIL